MILNQLKTQLGYSEPVTREFVAFMDSTFRYYSETRSQFFEKIPSHLHQSELISLINVEVKSRLFDEGFCNGIQDSLKSLRRAIIRLEDLRAKHPDHPDSVNNLTKLAALGEQVEALYQKHWEFYRYQNRLNEEELFLFLLEIDQVGYNWDIYLSGYSAIHGLVETLSGQPLPEHSAPLRITYLRNGPHHYSVNAIGDLMTFLEVGYRFICEVCGIDPETTPLSLLQIEVSRPVVVNLAVPEAAAPAFRKFLQYLFLKDMLKREALLKVVFEAIIKDVGPEKPPAPAVLTHYQKQLTARLKNLPPDGRFTISNRTFPDDGIRVLQEFTTALDEKNIRYDMLLGRKDGAKRPAKPRPAAKPKGVDAREPMPPPSSRSPETYKAPASLLDSMKEKDHIAVLTPKRREG